MSIRRWHVGKLIIVWAWGCIAAALALTDFLTRPVFSAPLLHLFELMFVVLCALALSGITWHWLGGKESR
jgi:hypothetical protein